MSAPGRSGTVRLTAAQALVRWLAALRVEGGERLFGGVWAIFGHGNVAGIGEALYGHRGELPTYRAHNEQAMAHAAIAYAKAHMRRRMMACTTSIGPGATNMVTAAALAHVNRLPVLLLPGDVFVSRTPDPVLQQVEAFHDGGISANDCFRPVSRYFDRIVHPGQLLTALPRALHVLTDAALCGPVTLAMPQDVQTMAYDWPEAFFAPPVVRFAAPPPIDEELADAAAALRRSRRPMIVAGGGTLYGLATDALRRFAETHGVPVAETQGGKGSLAWDHPLQAGAIGVTGSPAANALAREADCVLAIGTRLQDFTTGSHSLFPQATLVSLNVNGFDALKWHGTMLRADARRGLEALSAALMADEDDSCLELRQAFDKLEIVRLWAARKSLSNAVKRYAPLKLNEDVVVPVSRLADFVDFLDGLAELAADVLVGDRKGDNTLGVGVCYLSRCIPALDLALHVGADHRAPVPAARGGR